MQEGFLFFILARFHIHLSRWVCWAPPPPRFTIQYREAKEHGQRERERDRFRASVQGPDNRLEVPVMSSKKVRGAHCIADGGWGWITNGTEKRQQKRGTRPTYMKCQPSFSGLKDCHCAMQRCFRCCRSRGGWVGIIPTGGPRRKEKLFFSFSPRNPPAYDIFPLSISTFPALVTEMSDLAGCLRRV